MEPGTPQLEAGDHPPELWHDLMAELLTTKELCTFQTTILLDTILCGSGTTRLHGVTTQKMVLFVVTAVGTSNPTVRIVRG
jgi:hypothetical protein